MKGLTDDNKPFLLLAAKGYSNLDIAMKLNTNVKKVENVLFWLFKKNNIDNRVSLVVLGLKEGVIELEEL